MARNFQELLKARWKKGLLVCVGLDTDFERIPREIKSQSVSKSIADFNMTIVETTHDLVCAYKPNIAFYEAYGLQGITGLIMTIWAINLLYPEIPVILDAKRGDIGNTNNGYVKACFDIYKADAVTVPPYLGKEAMQPFLDKANKGIFVLCRTSNPGAGEFQDLNTWRDEDITRDGPTLVANEIPPFFIQTKLLLF